MNMASVTSVQHRLEEYRKTKSATHIQSEVKRKEPIVEPLQTAETIEIRLPKPEPLWLKQLGTFASNHRLILLGLKLLLFLLLQLIFAQLGFGSVFFVATLLFLLWTSMQPGARKPHEPSSYSVFNPGCERLLGQTTADQFEQEIRHGYNNS